MRRDYKSRDALYRPGSRRQNSRYGLIALFIATLCGSAIFISTQDDTVASEPNEPAAGTAALTLATHETDVITPVSATESQPAQLEVVALRLPNQGSIKKKNPPLAEAHKEVVQVSQIANPANLPLATSTTTVSKDTGQQEPSPVQNKLPPIQNTALNAESNQQRPEPVTVSAPAAPELASTPLAADSWIETKVKNGDSLAVIFSRLELSPNLLHRIVNSSKEAKQLAKIKPGEFIKVRQSSTGDFLELVHKKSAIRSMRILAANDQFTTKVINRDLEKRIAEASGTITSSLFVDASRAGLSDSLVMELANIFGRHIR